MSGEPWLSVVVPVYRVEEFLPACLDSLLQDSSAGAAGLAITSGKAITPADVEVIAVDDASPDGSGAILATYAARDPRLRVITLAHNGGLGAARNAGLAQARGRYVWFVDADDWLPAGTVPAVVAELARVAPDLLIVDYARVFPDGRAELFSAGDACPDPLPDVFTLADRPELLRSLHIACNKVVRREFLAGTGILFGRGWYEDVAFSIPLLSSAGRLAVFDRLCYAYRQRAGGSITSTVTDRHFDVFGHWERVFGHLDRHPELAPLRPAVFVRMVWHLLAVLSQPDRVPPARRGDFFAEMTRLYREHRPADGYRVPAGRAGVSYRLVGLGAYRPYQVARAARAALRRAARAARVVQGRIRPARRVGVH